MTILIIHVSNLLLFDVRVPSLKLIVALQTILVIPIHVEMEEHVKLMIRDLAILPFVFTVNVLNISLVNIVLCQKKEVTYKKCYMKHDQLALYLACLFRLPES